MRLRMGADLDPQPYGTMVMIVDLPRRKYKKEYMAKIYRTLRSLSFTCLQMYVRSQTDNLFGTVRRGNVPWWWWWWEGGGSICLGSWTMSIGHTTHCIGRYKCLQALRKKLTTQDIRTKRTLK
jgi:hypothetical protein